MAEFTVELRVDQSSGPDYKRFIEQLRTRLQNPGSYSHNRPVLPPQGNPPTRWFDIVLRTASQALRLRIRSDNLYLDGYRAENSQQWLEFNNNGVDYHLINGSLFLGFDGSYGNLTTAAEQRREQINLGRQQLVTAVNQLATTNDRRERARSLIIVIQMISESIRFAHISDTLANNFTSSAPPTSRMIALENGWGDVSAAMLHADDNPVGPFRLPQPNNMLIQTAAEAATAIGILLRYNIPRPLQTRMLTAGPMAPEGRALAEIFWVRIDNIDNETSGDLYGTITTSDGLNSQYIYNRSRDNADSGISPDDEVSRGQISWNIYDPTNTYDKARSQMISGKYGSATVNYIVMSNAAEALVKVILINGDGENPANVYGTLTARNTFGESELFRKGSSEQIQVRPQQAIPLSRSVIAVPMDTDLIINANLWDHDSGPSPDDEIANGTAQFRPQISASARASIYGKYGQVEVRVTWS